MAVVTLIFLLGAGVLLLIVSIFFATNRHVIDGMGARVSWYLRKYDPVFDKWYVKKDIESIINSYDKSDLGYEIGNRFVIRWQNSKTVADIDGPVLILDAGDNQTENIAKATIDYTKNGVLKESRQYLPAHISKAIDFEIAIDVLRNSKRNNAARELYNNWLLPELEDKYGVIPSDHPVKRAVQKLELLRRGGFLGPVLLTEYERLPEYGVPDGRIRQETENFMEFVVDLAMKKGGMKPIYFDGDFYHIVIILVGDNDYNFYVDKTVSNLSKYEVFHFLTVGRESVMDRIAKDLSNAPGVRECVLMSHELPEKTYLNRRDAYTIRVESAIY